MLESSQNDIQLNERIQQLRIQRGKVNLIAEKYNLVNNLKVYKLSLISVPEHELESYESTLEKMHFQTKLEQVIENDTAIIDEETISIRD